MKLKYSNLDFTPSSINEQDYTLRAVFSTADVDRHGEIVDQKSWILDDFEKNPVLLFGHDHSQPPVGKIIDLMYNQKGDLEGTVKFAAKEYPFANVIWNLYKGGFMRAFSVGFSAGKADVVNGTIVLKENKLFEISTVSVPANQMALAKSKGIDVEALEEVMKNSTSIDNTTDEAVIKKEDTEIVHAKDCPCQNKQPVLPTETISEEQIVIPDAIEGTTETIVEPNIDEEAAIAKSFNDVVEYVKAGRVLSAANRSGLLAAVDAITSVLEADKPSEDKSIEEAARSIEVKEVPIATLTPVIRENAMSARNINKTIRALLKQKRSK